ncbi:granzyme B-like [Micractinium conductrix]|uniref:Granzyme B-like n=1 Tax=Micractinium conductrix TaxID=554055 RepID=A0A2P6V564_9CHLO|nr:granzyme B-like [Micractinium conductrix]|eukprot:PSC69228.1 granzyme B-like [Micractinium conductrix]
MLEEGVFAQILNGHAAEPNRYDYVAQLRFPYANNKGVAKGQFVCAGVLIRPDVVLTTAWCASQSGMWPEVRLGALKTQGKAKETRKVVATAWHTGYLKQATVYNIVDNIALMKLDKPSKIAPICQPADFPNPAASVNENLCILGYGSTTGKPGSGLAVQLMNGNQRRLGQDSCDKMWGNFVDPCYANCSTSNWGTKQYLCTANGKKDEALCWEDSGAPLIRRSNNNAKQDMLIGLGAYTECKGKGNKQEGSVFTNVAQYYDWIFRGVTLFNQKKCKDTGRHEIACAKDYNKQPAKCTPVGGRCETEPSTLNNSAKDTCCVGSCILGACMPVEP